MVVTQVNLTESQQEALKTYRIALESRRNGICCNEGCTTCGIHRLRIKLENSGVPVTELQKILEADTARKTAEREVIEKLSDPEKPESQAEQASEVPKSYP